MAPLPELEERLGHRFADPQLLETALCHASHSHEVGEGRGNERLEFLGDAVIGLVVAQLLFELHPDWPEGELTRARAGLVNRQSLADCARALELGSEVRLGRSEQRSGGAEKPRILANCFEAVVGALFLEAGLAPVRTLARRLFAEAIARGPLRDAKSEFQEWAHAQLGETPGYHTTRDSGEEYDSERFTVEVRVAGEPWGEGAGRSKQLAELEAARDALGKAERSRSAG